MPRYDTKDFLGLDKGSFNQYISFRTMTVSTLLATEQRSIATNTYAILGLISFGEMSGYDLKRFADRSIHYFFWSPAASQVYSELRRLKSMGFVTECKVEQQTRPDKRLYRITQSGREELQRWLDHPDVDQDVRKSKLLLKLFLGRDTSLEVIANQLLARLSQMEDRLAQYEHIEREIKDQDDWLYPYLVLQSGLVHTRAEIEWIGGALEVLQGARDPKPSL